MEIGRLYYTACPRDHWLYPPRNSKVLSKSHNRTFMIMIHDHECHFVFPFPRISCLKPVAPPCTYSSWSRNAHRTNQRIVHTCASFVRITTKYTEPHKILMYKSQEQVLIKPGQGWKKFKLGKKWIWIGAMTSIFPRKPKCELSVSDWTLRK